jgi:hypothetical protein
MTAVSAIPSDLPPDIAWRWHKQRAKDMRREARAARGAHGIWHRFPLRGWRLPVTLLAFFLFWPAGLALLAVFLWRSDMNCANAAWMAPWKARVKDAMERHHAPASSGNLAFDDHRAAVLARLEEERRALDAQQAEFAAFMRNLRRAKDQEEFDRFMTERGGKPV